MPNDNVKFQDYYKTLGVERDASKDEIQKAYRKLARKYHPDMNKEAGAEDRFKEINEAYEVLKDEEKRKRYDALGQNWKDGQDFRPPPDWEEIFGAQFGGRRTQGGASFQFEGAGGFSDFFSALFGEQGTAGFQQGGSPFSGTAFQSQRGQDLEATLRVSLEEAYNGAKKTISFEILRSKPDGTQERAPKSYTVTVPAGTKEGSVIRLPGQGGKSPGQGKDGDLLLRVQFEKHPKFTPKGFDLNYEVPVAPWEAALGTELTVPTLNGDVRLKIPEGSQSGTKFRLKGKGLKKKGGDSGDLFAKIKIVVPEKLSEDEKRLFQQLQESSPFSPRK